MLTFLSCTTTFMKISHMCTKSDNSNGCNCVRNQRLDIEGKDESVLQNVCKVLLASQPSFPINPGLTGKIPKELPAGLEAYAHILCKFPAMISIISLSLGLLCIKQDVMLCYFMF